MQLIRRSHCLLLPPPPLPLCPLSLSAYYELFAITVDIVGIDFGQDLSSTFLAKLQNEPS